MDIISIYYSLIDGLYYVVDTFPFLVPIAMGILVSVSTKILTAIETRFSQRETSGRLKWVINFTVSLLVAFFANRREVVEHTISVEGFFGFMGMIMVSASGFYNRFKGMGWDTGIDKLIAVKPVVELPARAIEGQE